MTESEWAAHLREHERDQKAHQRQHESDAKAIELAVSNVDRRLGELNQLRSEVTTDRNQFLTRVEYNARHETLEGRVNGLEKLLDKAEGSLNVWRFIAGFLGLSGVAAIIWAVTQGGP
jgi:vacuolar-type H+-ATPase subunit E/Vma4